MRNYSFQFLRQFEKFVQKNKLIAAKDRIVVAVSGGLDSVVLLHLLIKFTQEYKLNLLIAHLNHSLRGEESDRDEKFVRQLASGNNIPVVTKKMEVGNFAETKGLSIETAARELRYNFLQEVRKENRFHKIATGHQADDQAETVMHNFLRGSGWRGLAGIPLERDNIIRPLLFASRSSLKRYAEENDLTHRTDSSNFTLDYRRNQIRHQLIPQLKDDYNPNISEILNQFAHIFREGNEYLTTQAQVAYYDCLKEKEKGKFILEFERFSNYFTIIQKYILFQLFAEAGLEQHSYSYRQVAELLHLIQNRRLGKSMPVAEKWYIGLDHSGIVFYIDEKIEAVNLSFHIGGEVTITGRNTTLTSKRLNRQEVHFNRNPSLEFIDADKITQPEFQVRSVQEGDSFFPLGLDHRQKLSDFFIDHKIPLWNRRRALVVTCQEKIVWLVGYRLDQRFKITQNTQNVIKLQVFAS